MGKLIEIKSEMLQFCSKGFAFRETKTPEYEQCLGDVCGLGQEFWPLTWDNVGIRVLVDDEDYEYAVLHHIRNTIDIKPGSEWSIVKLFGEVSLFHAADLEIPFVISLLCDPRPDVEGYTIDLE